MDRVDDLRLEVARQPSLAAYLRLGEALKGLGDGQGALENLLIATFWQAALLSPQDADALFQLAMALHRSSQATLPGRLFQGAVALRPEFAEAWANLGTLSQNCRQLRHAVTLQPQNRDLHCNHAHALLQAGNWVEGFREWEWRAPSPPREFAAPVWQGEADSSATLLVYAEQGFGDSIQFARFLPMAAQRVGRLVVETRAPLAGILGRVEGVDDVVLWGDDLPSFDRRIALPSLAHLFAPEMVGKPYLSLSEPHLVKWREKIPSGCRNVGLIWAGNLQGPDPRRALPFPLLAAWAARQENMRLIGLQRERGYSDPAILDLGTEIADFDDLAAAMSLMDAIVTVDTAAAHLAAGLGLRPIVLLHDDADWRWWGATPDSTIWYEGVRLVRQTRPGAWGNVLDRVSALIQ
jgi:hypothetical protein